MTTPIKITRFDGIDEEIRADWAEFDVHDADLYTVTRWQIDGTLPTHYAIRFNGDRPDRYAIVHPCAKLGMAGEIQVTEFDDDGPICDVVYKTMDALLSERHYSSPIDPTHYTFHSLAI